MADKAATDVLVGPYHTATARRRSLRHAVTLMRTLHDGRFLPTIRILAWSAEIGQEFFHLIMKVALKTVCLFSFLAASAYGQGIPAQAELYRSRLVREAHAKFGLAAPITIFAAQIHQESRWHENAKSPVGALGLAQFMPGTAEWISHLYPADLGDDRPLDAGWALRALVSYDAYLYGRLGEYKEDGLHRWGATLSSYNGGLGNVNKERRLVLGMLPTARPALCDEMVSRYFWCTNQMVVRSDAADRENKAYPISILFRWEPLYRRAGW